MRSTGAQTPLQLAYALAGLARANMTVISAVTYLAGAVLATSSGVPLFSTNLFLRGWLFILLTQFMTHFLGEYYDFASDRLNRNASRLTGGSRVLTTNQAPRWLAFAAGYFAMVFSFLTLEYLVAAPARPIGRAMLFLAWGYSVPPLKFNHRALGELDASLVTSAFVPYFAAAAQQAETGQFPWWSDKLVFLVVPPFFVKIALFLVLNLADKRPDWASGKITLPVVLGTKRTAQLHFACMCIAYSSAIVMAAWKIFNGADWKTSFILAFILPSAPYGFAISKRLLANPPYKLDPLLAPSLFHSTLLVWGVVLHALLTDIPVDGILSFQVAFATLLAFITIKNLLKARRKAAERKAANRRLPTGKVLEQAGVRTFSLLGNHSGTEGGDTATDPLVSAEEGTNGLNASQQDYDTTMRDKNSLDGHQRYDVIIVGGGVGGLVAASALYHMGRSVIVLERRDASEAESGADLALWPGTIAILRDLGVADSFFERDCFPLETVHMCNMDFEQISSREGMGSAATILKTIDMKAVTEGTGENFVLVPRQRLMDALRSVVPADRIVYGANFTAVDEQEDDEQVMVRWSVRGASSSANDSAAPENERTAVSRIVIGADGARSKLRAHVSPDHGGPDSVRFCGEVCYRGVLDFSDESMVPADLNESQVSIRQIREKLVSLFPDAPADRTMRINYGAGLRSSFGFMSADGDVAYWWVKELKEAMPENRGKLPLCTWPEPLKTLHDLTPETAFYMHAIEDSASLPRWSTTRVVLVGDAAHVVTPNMGQGACLATEDAFVLATELAQNWRWHDGHLEAFYNYEQVRRPYSDAVAKESRKQLFLGQLSSRPAVFLRELLLGIVPTSVLQKTLRKNNFPVNEYLNIFREVVVDATMRKA